MRKLGRYCRTSVFGMFLLAGAGFSTACGSAESPDLAADGLSDAAAGERVETLSSPLLATGVCDVRTAQSMNVTGSYNNLASGGRRLISAGSALSFWMNPPVTAGTWKVNFYMRATNDGSTNPRVRVRRGTTLLREIPITPTTGYVAYSSSFTISSTSSSVPLSVEYISDAAARSVEVLRAEIVCPANTDAPGVVCADNVCAPGQVCCDGTSADRPIFCFDPATSPGECGVFHFPMRCDGQRDCGTGNVCRLTYNDKGASAQCVPGSVSTTPLLICGTRTHQTFACPAGQYCSMPSAEGIGWRACMPN